MKFTRTTTASTKTQQKSYITNIIRQTNKPPAPAPPPPPHVAAAVGVREEGVPAVHAAAELRDHVLAAAERAGVVKILRHINFEAEVATYWLIIVCILLRSCVTGNKENLNLDIVYTKILSQPHCILCKYLNVYWNKFQSIPTIFNLCYAHNTFENNECHSNLTLYLKTHYTLQRFINKNININIK